MENLNFFYHKQYSIYICSKSCSFRVLGLEEYADGN